MKERYGFRFNEEGMLIRMLIRSMESYLPTRFKWRDDGHFVAWIDAPTKDIALDIAREIRISTIGCEPERWIPLNSIAK